MNLVDRLEQRWSGIDAPFLITTEGNLRFDEIKTQKTADLSAIGPGDVVALIGDFDPISILNLLKLIDKNVILAPLTTDTRVQHEYFFESALVDFVIEQHTVKRISHKRQHPLIDELRSRQRGGLILFSTGTTGRPKAILHDLTLFMQRFETARPGLRTINFLLFDHIGGLNTLLHTLFNKGTVVAPKSRAVEDILALCAEYAVEVLPATPTFLRMMLMSGLVPDSVPDCLKIITYGTERMDQPTLDALCALLPQVEFRQTFGMSELGIVRVKSKARNSLFMRIGGEGVETRVVDEVLEIRSETRMLGYLNANTPFDRNGWYRTNDIVEEDQGFFRVIGRVGESINVGGLKFMPSEVERVALEFEGIELAKVEGKCNPITGQHVELTVQPVGDIELNINCFRNHLMERLPSHMVPKRIKVSTVHVGHRFKKT